jgi:hypothetical protein
MPTDELEHELRNAFARAATGLEQPEQARERLLRHRYRPARGHLRPTAGVAAVAVGATALGLGLSGAFSSTPARFAGTIRTTAFTLTANANGTDTLTIKPQILLEPRLLQNDLAKYGIPAKVTTGSVCSSNPAPAGFLRVVSFGPPSTSARHQGAVRNPTITINPAAMPKGTELSFGNFKLSGGPGAAFTLMDKNHYTCSSATPPHMTGDGAWLQSVPSHS